MIRLLLSAFAMQIFSFTAFSQCNGDPDICDKRYDHVVYVTTHNAYNYSPSFQLPNQSFSVAQQMQDGVRAFMLDVHNDVFGTPSLYHGITPVLGSEPLEDVLSDIKQFIDQNPNEILTIIFEAYINASEMDAVFTSTGLKPYLFTQTFGQPWPTLQEMINNNERLVVFSDIDDAGAGQEWYHYVWDYCVETHYSNSSRADFSCNFNRGDSINSLFILNHFVTNQTLGTGELDSSVLANSNPYFLNRANQCMQEKGKLPNFLTVDFYDVGNVFETKDELNENYIGIPQNSVHLKDVFSVFPNPFDDYAEINILNNRSLNQTTIRVLDIKGRVLKVFTSGHYKDGTLLLKDLGKGMLFVQLLENGKVVKTTKAIMN